MVRGIILAGGSGSRLFPTTLAISKQLLPVYDKPLVYYPIATLMLAGIRQMVLVSAPHQIAAFRTLLGDGHQLGIEIDYATQEQPRGIAESLIIAEPFIAGHRCALALGDNIFFGPGLGRQLASVAQLESGADIFCYPVSDPERYGVASFDASGRVIDLVEKPATPQSNAAVTGLYFFDEQAPYLARQLKPSARGELEITDLNRVYMSLGSLRAHRLGRGVAWLDTGTPDALHAAAAFVATIQQRQGLRIACLEEIAFRMGYIDIEQLEVLAHGLAKSSYGAYLSKIADEHARSQPQPYPLPNRAYALPA